MNIISAKIYLIAICVLITFSLNFQTAISKQTDSTFSLSAEFGAGFSSHTSDLFEDVGRWGISWDFRTFWEPGHLLNLGIEASVLPISHQIKENVETEFGITDTKAYLNAIPILLVFNMKVWEIDIYTGMGVSYVWSTLESFDNEVTSHEWDYCFMLSYGYTYPLTEKSGIGIEMKTFTISKIDKIVGGIHLKYKYKFYTW